MSPEGSRPEPVLTLARLARERKAEDIAILDLRGVSAFTDFMLILSGRSTRQVQALAENLLEDAGRLKIRPLSHEGLESGRWVILDYGDVVVHVFLQEVRAYYDLEGLWSDAPCLEWPPEGPEPEI